MKKSLVQKIRECEKSSFTNESCKFHRVDFFNVETDCIYRGKDARAEVSKKVDGRMIKGYRLTYNCNKATQNYKNKQLQSTKTYNHQQEVLA